MNQVKFNKFERVAGAFVVVAVGGFLLSMLSVAVKQGWFDQKIHFTTTFESADGVHAGTAVQIAGLKAGAVKDVDLLPNNKVLVKFYVLSKFHSKIKTDSHAELVRPFIIGEKILDVSVGSESESVLVQGATMNSVESMDLMTMISGKQIGTYLHSISEMGKSLHDLAKAFLDKSRTQTLIEMFDSVEPLIKNLNQMSVEVIKLAKQATHDERLGGVLGELAITTRELNKIIPELNAQAPYMAKDIKQIVQNLSVLTEEFKVFIPALQAVAPSLPAASKRAVEALDEAVVLIKAMQRSFFVSGSTKEVRKEEAERESKNRLPANQ